MSGEKRENDLLGESVQKATFVIVDIEGTTTSISYVKDTLFPYIRENLEEYLKSHWENAEFEEDLVLLRDQAAKDEAEKVEGAVSIPAGKGDDTRDAILKNILWQMDFDRKTKALKQLQGHVMREGYTNGKLKGHVYDDVVPALQSWVHNDRQIYVYSSGSVDAQKLLFGHSVAGDLLELFSGHFDTEIGPKTEAGSYLNILTKLGCKGDAVVFFTDVPKEAQAAHEAGMNAVLVSRPGNSPLSDDDHVNFAVIKSFHDIVFEASAKRKRLSVDEEREIPKKDVINGPVSQSVKKTDSVTVNEDVEMVDVDSINDVPKVSDSTKLGLAAPTNIERSKTEQEDSITKEIDDSHDGTSVDMKTDTKDNKIKSESLQDKKQGEIILSNGVADTEMSGVDSEGDKEESGEVKEKEVAKTITPVDEKCDGDKSVPNTEKTKSSSDNESKVESTTEAISVCKVNSDESQAEKSIEKSDIETKVEGSEVEESKDGASKTDASNEMTKEEEKIEAISTEGKTATPIGEKESSPVEKVKDTAADSSQKKEGKECAESSSVEEGKEVAESSVEEGKEAVESSPAQYSKKSAESLMEKEEKAVESSVEEGKEAVESSPIEKCKNAAEHPMDEGKEVVESSVEEGKEAVESSLVEDGKKSSASLMEDAESLVEEGKEAVESSTGEKSKEGVELPMEEGKEAVESSVEEGKEAVETSPVESSKEAESPMEEGKEAVESSSSEEKALVQSSPVEEGKGKTKSSEEKVEQTADSSVKDPEPSPMEEDKEAPEENTDKPLKENEMAVQQLVKVQDQTADECEPMDIDARDATPVEDTSKSVPEDTKENEKIEVKANDANSEEAMEEESEDKSTTDAKFNEATGVESTKIDHSTLKDGKSQEQVGIENSTTSDSLKESNVTESKDKSEEHKVESKTDETSLISESKTESATEEKKTEVSSSDEKKTEQENGIKNEVGLGDAKENGVSTTAQNGEAENISKTKTQSDNVEDVKAKKLAAAGDSVETQSAATPVES